MLARQIAFFAPAAVLSAWATVMFHTVATGRINELLSPMFRNYVIIAAFAPFSIPAKLAFMIAGPLIDMKLYWVYRSCYQARFVHLLWLLATSAVFVLTFLYALKP